MPELWSSASYEPHLLSLPFALASAAVLIVIAYAAAMRGEPILRGDLVVWYTDGVVEAQDPAGAPFGERRLQHLLKQLEHHRHPPRAVHDLVHRGEPRAPGDPAPPREAQP